ncbi:MAG: 2-oxo acid dehydrogenase subunit E2, partial [Planctomycetota bacterium]
EKPQAKEAEPAGEDQEEAKAKREPEEEEAEAEEPKEKKAPEPKPARREGERIAISPYAKKLAEERGIDYAQIQGSGPGGRIVAADIEAAAEEGAPKPEKKEEEPKKAKAEPRKEKPAPKAKPKKEVAAEPLARVLAEKLDFDIAEVAGTGLNGRVTVDDVLSELQEREAARGEDVASPSADEEFPPIDVREGEAEVTDASFRHKTQVRIVSASKHVIPHFYITRGADVTALLDRKDELKEKHGATVTHLIILACIRALQDHPEINRAYDRGHIIAWKGIHIGLAIDTDEGLTVAVLRDAHDLALADVAEKARALVDKARSGKLSAEERRQPGLTVSNLGMFDVEHFQPIINPPSSVTVGVSSALDAPVVRDGEVQIGKVLKLTLSCDHRILDGVMAATFLQTLKALLEDPDTLLEGQ